MTVQQLISRLQACRPDDEVVVPCFGCGDAESEATLVTDHDGVVVVMCKTCAEGSEEQK